MDPYASIAEIRRGLASKKFSAVELTQFHIDRINALDGLLNCFITVAEERALASARAADAHIANGRAGSLTGVPIALKDIFCTDGVKTTCASRMLDNFVAPYDSTVAAKLSDAQTVMLGKTNMDEFAMGSSSENSFYGPVKNPWDTDRVAGGSSGGSAAAVAAGLATVAAGTDTGGSIRQPAAFCGVTGLKPTYGRVSRYGMIAFASSLDQGGPIARSIDDVATMLQAMEGHDPRDSTSASHPATPEYDADRRYTIGLPDEYWNALDSGGISAALNDAKTLLESSGHAFKAISLAHTDAAIPTYYVVAGAEASTNLSRYDGVRFGHRAEAPNDLDDLYQRSRSEGFGAEVKRRILTGTYALSVGYYDAYYLKAQRIRHLIRQDFLEAFEQVDLILAPVAPTTAFRIGALTADPVAMYQQDVFTIPASLAGLPSVSLPCGFVDGLPVGMQLIGAHFHEADLLAVGAAFQRQTQWHQQHPEIGT